MYLCRSLEYRGCSLPMVGAVPADAVMYDRPQGRGQIIATPSGHPWLTAQRFRAHEFHYSGLRKLADGSEFALTISRGVGIKDGSDGMMVHNLTAGFCHLRHTEQSPWIADFLKFVRTAAS